MATLLTSLPVQPGNYAVRSLHDVVECEYNPTLNFYGPAGGLYFQDRNVVLSPDADFEWRGLSIPEGQTLQLRFHIGNGYYLSNIAVPSAFLAGDAANPFSLYPGITVPKGGKVGIELTLPGGQATVAQIQLRGVKKYRKSERLSTLPAGMADQDLYIDLPFWYYYTLPITNSTNPAIATVPNISLLVDSDANFAWRSLMYTSTGPFNILIRNSSSERQLSNVFVPSANINGYPSVPAFRYPEMVVPRGGQFLVDVQDTSGGANTINLLFGGVKRFVALPAGVGQ